MDEPLFLQQAGRDADAATRKAEDLPEGVVREREGIGPHSIARQQQGSVPGAALWDGSDCR